MSETYKEIQKEKKELCIECKKPVSEHWYDYGYWKPHEPKV